MVLLKEVNLFITIPDYFLFYFFLSGFVSPSGILLLCSVLGSLLCRATLPV